MPSPAINPPPAEVAFNPQLLGAGYAVLVEYGHRLEIATLLQQILNRPVGLVSYSQRPYLLATYTADLGMAASLMQQLSDRSLTVFLVDSRTATLLTPQVSGL